jgi:hypothetical protein
LAEAEDWAATHTLLMARFAACWFLGMPLERQRLQDTVRRLQPHEAEVDHALGGGTFYQGAGLYAGYFYLQVTTSSLNRGGKRNERTAAAHIT